MDFFKSLIMGFLKPLTKQEQLEKHLLDLICSGYEPLTYYSSVLDRCYMPAREFERAKRILKEISKG